jgi:hypothetical protein
MGLRATRGLLAGFQIPGRPDEHLPQPDDGGVSRIEMFPGPVHDGAHAFSHGIVLLRDRPDTRHEGLLLGCPINQVIIVEALEPARGVCRIHQHVAGHDTLPLVSRKGPIWIVLNREAHGIVVIDGDSV